MQIETLRLETENRVEQARLVAEQEKLDEIQKIREKYRQDLERLANGEQNRYIQCPKLLYPTAVCE